MSDDNLILGSLSSVIRKELDEYDARKKEDEQAAKEKHARKEQLSTRISIAAIALTILMSSWATCARSVRTPLPLRSRMPRSRTPRQRRHGRSINRRTSNAPRIDSPMTH